MCAARALRATPARSGYLSFDELLVGLRGELNPRRLDMVERAFKVLDVTGDGQVTLDDVKGRYDASKVRHCCGGVSGQNGAPACCVLTAALLTLLLLLLLGSAAPGRAAGHQDRGPGARTGWGSGRARS